MRVILTGVSSRLFIKSASHRQERGNFRGKESDQVMHACVDKAHKIESGKEGLYKLVYREEDG